MYYLLLYQYVDNILEARTPYRDAHLACLNALVDSGQVVLGGALADPELGAAIVFKVDDRTVVEDFVRNDPYHQNGLITGWRIAPWQVVVGTRL